MYDGVLNSKLPPFLLNRIPAILSFQKRHLVIETGYPQAAASTPNASICDTADVFATKII